VDTAPGRIAFRKTIVIARRASERLAVPALAKSKISMRSIGKIAMIAGGGTTATGLVLALVARSRYHAPFDSGACDPTTRMCTGEGASAANSARTLANVSTVVTLLGLGAAGAGAYLWLRSPHATAERKVSVVPHVGPDGAGVMAFGRF
jgi:hypothetical protein